MSAAPSTPPAPVHTSARDLARRAVLVVAQAELTGGSSKEQRAEAADALKVAGICTGDIAQKYIREGWTPVRELLAIALRCTVVSRCGCGAEISGAEWPYLELVGTQRFGDQAFELRTCSACGSTRAARIP